MSNNPSEVEAALELTQFLLRYHRAIDYGDFSDNPYVVQRIRRYHDYKIWFEIEELSGGQDDANINFNEFKDVTSKALQEIVEHLQRISKESDSKIMSQASQLAKRVNDDIADLNKQISSVREQREGLQTENYKQLLDLISKLQNKMKQTSSNIMGELRKEFEAKISDSEKAGEGRLQERDSHIEGRFTALNDRLSNLSDTEALNEVRKELEKIISDRRRQYEASFTHLQQLISEGETRSAEEVAKRIADLRSQIQDTIAERFSHAESNASDQQKNLMSLLHSLEDKLESKNIQIVKDL